MVQGTKHHQSSEAQYSRTRMVADSNSSMIGVMLPVCIGLATGAAFIGLFALYPIPSQYNGPGSNVVITLQRTPCFGDCPVYSLAIYENGFVVFRHLTDPESLLYSHAFGVDLTGGVRPHIYQVSKESVANLVDEFHRIDYLSLNDTYYVSITDLSATITSITTNGSTKSVYNYLGGPRELFELEYKIDEVAGTRFWVEDYEERILSFNQLYPQ